MPQSAARDPFVRPRSRGALLVTVNGVVVLIAERRGARIAVRPDTAAATVTAAVQALIGHLVRLASKTSWWRRSTGSPRAGAQYVDAFQAAGLRRGTAGLRFYRKV